MKMNGLSGVKNMTMDGCNDAKAMSMVLWCREYDKVITGHQYYHHIWSYHMRVTTVNTQYSYIFSWSVQASTSTL